jgi:thiamine pyrophosphate-dependent acetolactate synthase large subunit-like protein
MRGGRIYGVLCSPKPDYAKLSESYRGYGEEVTDPSEVNQALSRALKYVKKGGQTLLDVVLPGC